MAETFLMLIRSRLIQNYYWKWKKKFSLSYLGGGKKIGLQKGLFTFLMLYWAQIIQFF